MWSPQESQYMDEKIRQLESNTTPRSVTAEEYEKIRQLESNTPPWSVRAENHPHEEV